MLVGTSRDLSLRKKQLQNKSKTPPMDYSLGGFFASQTSDVLKTSDV